ncbi:Cof-type HAD-IIB family hydrolase [Xylocopilactobacillus apis]|uniref:Sugar phosphatase SupH n=1 Tax=Xylocopilactobacillus apis TaxID=2932183 RepID=A0AAU9CZE7_9LACO|nr:Cof-type HAD-IIB family hydrolase [Xylocopilactobacillus apis]BDR55616.1 sugar phosphatase SupH [Xylocopilactobacillus apis]
MSVKLIAVDMDGTFLDDQKQYNHEYFDQLYRKMKQQHVEFVVASGNQYYQLSEFFAPYKEEITFVAENGGNIYLHNEPIYHAKVPKNVNAKVAQTLSHYKPDFIVACGFKSAYALDGLTDEEYKMASFFFPQIQKVHALEDIEDDIIKYSLDFAAAKTSPIRDQINEELNNELVLVPTGGGGIDLILPKVHKATGIKKVQEQLGIADDEVAAFGDNGNDKEMLNHAKYSFAMGNATDEIKGIARNVIGNNNDEAVLKTIDQLLTENEQN